MWPDKILHNVDLPLPLSPIKPIISLFLRDNDMSFNIGFFLVYENEILFAFPAHIKCLP